jgi:hypothetical protein
LGDHVDSGDFYCAGGGFEQGGQDQQGGGFACSVGSEESEDLSWCHGQVEPVHGGDLAAFGGEDAS